MEEEEKGELVSQESGRHVSSAKTVAESVCMEETAEIWRGGGAIAQRKPPPGLGLWSCPQLACATQPGNLKPSMPSAAAQTFAKVLPPAVTPGRR